MAFDKSVFAAKLRGKRAEMDISQDELARRSGVSQASIFKYEDGSSMLGADKLFALAEALGCTPNDLMGWDRG